MTGSHQPPRLAVLIPTYNRAPLLHETLRSLTRQSIPASEFEVVVGDDGSSDDTAAVVGSFADRLRVSHCFQEDLGFRAGAARNMAARATDAPLLVFLDSGCRAGPELLAHHLRAHLEAPERRAVLGSVHGINATASDAGLRDLYAALEPEEVVRRYEDEPGFTDLRHSLLADDDLDLDRLLVPWIYFFSANFSVAAADYWAVGGFDEDFRGWGGEDLELGLRLWRDGVRLRMHPEAWAVEFPHERDMQANFASFRANMGLLLAKHPEPDVEVGWAEVTQGSMFDWERDCRALARHRRGVRELDVADEIAEATAALPAGARVAVLGCGGRLPARLAPGAVVADFDAALLARATAGRPHPGHHALGLRIPLPPASVDTVLVTSRLAGLWHRWGELITAEAARIGHDVRILTPPSAPPPPYAASEAYAGAQRPTEEQP
jgi:GT2 family glycosyltransferase